MSLDNLTTDELAQQTIELMEQCPDGVCLLDWSPSLDYLNRIESIKQDMREIRHSVYRDLR